MSQQQWAFEPTGSVGGGVGGRSTDGSQHSIANATATAAATRAAGTTTATDGGTSNFSIISLAQNLCLSVGGDQEVYAALLSTGCATAVLFNSGPNTATVTVSTADLAAGVSYQPGRAESSVRDLWLHQDVGNTTGGVYSASVPSHAVVHVNICPQ